MTAVMCKHKRQLTVCAECAPEAERQPKPKPPPLRDIREGQVPEAEKTEVGHVRLPTSGGDTKFRLGLVKRSNGEPIPEDEPFFVLRARDHLAVPLLREYYTLCVGDDCNDDQLAGADTVLRQFEHFAVNHPKRMKQPGMTRGE